MMTNESKAIKQKWFYDRQGPLIILGPLEVSTKQDKEKITYTFTYPVLWRRSEVNFGDKEMGLLEKLETFVKLVSEIESIVESNLSWKDKYDLVFSESLSRKISRLGISLDYYDPDTSYEEDVLAYYRAVKNKANEFKKVIEGRS